ncbi:CubicO group peptidase, beta-lactamase class C family [Pedococcus dokdonensis]|uniref:CubicO group peptidase, beta-lactamase class C family n=1 Tax=Pedococcus dokdonensis TaxID=443156 RepID=A0A1H0UFJ8_9MICO|nr:serine hydrolase [Pedococcus dokdonensis]SDP64987.1 CubicO group peptidase, beta-lactamase class C family [Pedococcus dokdonensis]
MTATPASAEDFSKPFHGFAPPTTVLRDGSPASVGLDPAPIAAAVAQVRGHESAPPDGHPMYAGAVGLMGHDGKVVERDASGWALRYADATTELPRDQWVPMRDDTVFDLASVSKLFTSLAVTQLVEEGKVELESPVATYLPEFAANGKEAVTVRHLLTHTSGFTSWLPLWSKYPDKASRIKAVMDQPLTNPVGSTYLYSDLNLITLGVLVERLRGEPLDRVVAERITAPLGMSKTGYNPIDRTRTAATEYQSAPARGMVWGEVHDENAWSLGGVAGHAGVFSTADDLAVLSQALLNGGTYRGHRILSRDSVTALITNFNEAFPGDDHGLGFELNQRWYMDSLSGPRTAGHTGYTGTSIVIDFSSRSFAILLTNRVHPSRSWGSNNLARREWAGGLGQALRVRPAVGATAWSGGAANAATHTLTTPSVAVPASGARLGFDLFLDTEETDLLTLERSTDGGATWQPLPFTTRDRGGESASDGTVSGTRDRHWLQARADLPPGAQQLRWRYTTDATNLGRGVYVDGIRLTAGRAVLLDAEKSPTLLTADGWTLRSR